MADFLETYRKAREEKGSVLCVGLDPLPQEVKEDEVLEYCLDVVSKTSEYAVAYKPNTQFTLFPIGMKGMKELNRKIRSSGCISILDHKLSDIGSTNEAGFYWIKEAGFDAVTVSPFPGNIAEATEQAHRADLGAFILTLMSNSQATWIQKEAMINYRPLYQRIAEEAKKAGADGLVIGATGHVTEYDIKISRELAGSNAIFLCPGIGAQGGDMEKVMKNAGQNVLINVGRAILSDTMPGKKAKEYRDEMNRYR